MWTIWTIWTMWTKTTVSPQENTTIHKPQNQHEKAPKTAATDLKFIPSFKHLYDCQQHKNYADDNHSNQMPSHRCASCPDVIF